MDNRNLNQNKYTRKKRNTLRNILIALTLLVAIPITGGFAYLFYLTSKITTLDINDKKWSGTEGSDTTKSTKPIKEQLGIKPEAEKEIQKKPDSKKIRNILLLGIDSTGDSGRSDAIMIMSIDQTTKKIKLSSIMRDSYVNIEGYGKDKINHAYAYGGAKLTLNTVNSNFNMNITDVIVVNFSQLSEIVNSVGGVKIHLTSAEAAHLGYSGEGTYTLDGNDALSYSRIRKLDNDFGRTNRQRTVMTALLSKLTSLSITQIPGVAEELLPLVWTTLNTGDIIATGIGVVTTGYKFEGKAFPGENESYGITNNGVWYMGFDQDDVNKELHSFIFNQ